MQLEEGRQKANEAFAATAWNKGLKEMAGAVFDAAITPNLLPDEAAIEAAREEKRAEGCGCDDPQKPENCR